MRKQGNHPMVARLHPRLGINNDMQRILWILALLAFGTAGSAWAQASPGACATGSVEATQNSSCTIGDLLFTFGNAQIRDDSGLSHVTLASLTFTPLTDGTGFTVSGLFTETNGEGELDWFGIDASTLNGQPTIVGVTASIRAVATPGSGYAKAFAEFGVGDPNDPNNYAYAQPGNSTGCENRLTCTGSFASPVSVAAGGGGDVLLGGDAYNGGSVTSRSTTFIVNEAAPVPEPAKAMLLLFGSAIVFGKTRFRRRRG